MPMPEEHRSRPNVFTGGLDLESDLTLVEQNDYVDALSIRNGLGSLGGVVVNAQGNVEVVNSDLPAGTNICIGTCEDKRCNSVLFFIYNSNGDHSIYRYFINQNDVDPNGEIELVARGEIFNFNQDWLVHSAEIVDTKFLYWTDGYSEKNFIEGNPPRKINAEKGNIVGKMLTYDLYAGLPNQGQFASSPGDGNVVRVEVRNRTTGLVVSAFQIDEITLSGFQDDPDGFLEYVANEVNTQLVGLVEAEFCEGCKSTFKVLSADNFLNIGETNPPIPNKNLHFVRTNSYPDLLQDIHIDLIKHPPVCEPKVRYVIDGDQAKNYVVQNIFQFRIRYWYDDGEKSAWGPISLLALPLDKSGELLVGFNGIEVDFTDPRLNDADILNVIRKVEIAVREGNSGLFRSVETLDVCEIGINQQFYVFKNDKLYSVVQSDDAVAEGQTQALKLFDSVPRISGTLETVADKEGNNRLFCGANLENYDNPDCIDIDYEVTTNEDEDCFITIKGTVQIQNDPKQTNDGYFRASGGEGLSGDDATVLEGFVVYLAGTNFYGISKSFDIETVTSPTGEFEITNVPRGRYILRVAGYKCRFNDDYGPRYNLTNGREWQRTSAPLVDCAGSLAATGIATERVIDLTAAGQVFDLDIEPSYGPIVIQNLQDSLGGATGLQVIEFYTVDNNGVDSDPDDISEGINVERQRIDFTVGTSGPDLNFQRITDHNGYSYVLWDQGIPAPRNLKNVRLVVADVCGVGPTRELAGGSLNLYEGGWRDVSLGNQNLNNSALGNPSGGSSNISNIIFTVIDNVFTTSNKTIINGETQDSSTSGLPRVLMAYTRNTRPEETNTIGRYSITVYCPFDSFGRSDDDLIATYTPDSCYNFPPNTPIQTPNISDFCGNPYDINNPYTALTVIYPFAGALNQVARYLKAGGVYRVGLVYEDRANRKSTVVEAETLEVPFFTERNSFTRTSVKWSISSLPPEWATHYRIVLSRESYYRRYLQWLSEDVRYVRIENFEDPPIDTSFVNGDATHILIKISTITTSDGEGNPVEWFFVGSNTQGFNAQPNDRVRFILDEAGDLVIQNDILDFPIVGNYRDGDDYFIVVEDIEAFREVKPNWLIELYTPKNNEEVVFYEMGECHAILDAGTDDRRHAGPVQNQVVGGQPAEGFFAGGDTYWRIKQFTVSSTVDFVYEIENLNITDVFESEFSDIGRPNVRDDDFGERFYFNRIRFSGIFIPDSKINGLSAFRAADYQSVDLEFGNIMKLMTSDEVMLAICQFKTQPIYVAKDRILDLSGAGSIGRSDKILNLANELKYDFGTMNPESVIEQDGTIYAWDVYTGQVWRYASNGQFAISKYKAQRFFNGLKKGLFALDRKDTRVFGFYEREYDLYGITFEPNEVVENGLTIEFAEAKNRWNNRMPFIGEYYCAISDFIVSFKEGRLYLHEGFGNTPCNFYGVQEDARIKLVSNDMPRATKVFWNMQIQSDNQWEAVDISVEPNFNYPNGMRSELLANQWVAQEGIWRSDFLRDKTDPNPEFNAIVDPVERELAKLFNGRVLRGEVLIVEINLVNSSIDSVLRRVDIEHNMSMDTKA